MTHPQRLEPRPWRGIIERADRSGSQTDPSRSASLVVAVVALAGLSAFALLLAQAELPDRDSTLLALVLAFLGGLSEVFSYKHRKGASGSIALIPFAACALIQPSAWGVLWVIVAGVVVQVAQRRDLLKSVFNVGQLVLGLSVGVFVLNFVGGGSIIELKGQSFVPSVRDAILPAFALTSAAFLMNSLCVSAILSVTQRKPYIKTWKAATLATLPYHPLTVLIVFYVAWLSTNLGAFGTAGMAVPMLAVRQLYSKTMELTNVTEELLDLMVAAIEARDPYTSGHSRRVAMASKIIATALGLSPAQVERVTVAALLHDVGKIDEKFAPILAKEGRLTSEEWELMKRHPIRGAELVGMLSSLHDIVSPVRHHHENWDGTGYPDGIKADAIPLASRIIMFADTLDAITTDRPYRKALNIEEARKEFIKFRGKQFDPGICDVVVSVDVWAELYSSAEGARISTPTIGTTGSSKPLATAVA